MGDLLPFLIEVNINESSMATILYFADVTKIVGAHINMETSKKKKVINADIKYGKSFISKHVKRVFSAPILMTPP